MLRQVQEVDRSKLIGDQAIAFQELYEFVASDQERQMFCLEAAGGCGKTFLTSMLTEHILHTTGRMVGMGALTHKAVFVQTKMAEYDAVNLEYRTIQSVLGVKPQIDDDGRETFFRSPKDAEKSSVGDYDLILIDEVSQMGNQLFSYLKQDLDRFPDTKIIFMGDRFQLPPVESGFAIPLNPYTRESNNIKHFELTKIIRQKDGSPVISHCKNVRDDIVKLAKSNCDKLLPKVEGITAKIEEGGLEGKVLENAKNGLAKFKKQYANNMIFCMDREIPANDFYTPRTEVNSSGEGIIFVTKKDQPRVLKTLFCSGEFEKNPDFVRMVSWTNKEVDRYNNLVRKMLYRENIANFIKENKAKSDLKGLVRGKFPYYNLDKNELRLPKYLKGDQIIVDKPIFSSDQSEILFNTNEELEITDIVRNSVIVMNERYDSYQAVVENIWTGKKGVIEICHEDSERLLERELQKMADSAKKATRGSQTSRSRWKDYYSLHKFFAKLKYLPSMTTYKAQGSTYENIIVNYGDIIRNPKKIQGLQHLYVGMSRASKTVYIFE